MPRVQRIGFIYWDFCNKSITTDTKEICYCSKDGLDWICAECFNDFKEKFGWTVLDNIQDIPAEGFIPLRATIASEKKTDELQLKEQLKESKQIASEFNSGAVC